MASLTTGHPHCDAETVPKRPCALLWDESFLWGVMAWRALKAAGLPFDLLRSEDIRQGALSRYRMIFVPGGWASNKISALGERGREEIRRFVAAGGSYLGICGGGGMATENGLGLLPIQRRPSSERVPSFSGRIRLSSTPHAIWQNVETHVFCAWWPSQFQIEDRNVRILAAYDGSEHANRALYSAFEMATALKAGLTVLAVGPNDDEARRARLLREALDLGVAAEPSDLVLERGDPAPGLLEPGFSLGPGVPGFVEGSLDIPGPFR